MKKFLLALSLMFVGAVSLFVVSCGASTYSLTFNTDGGAEISAVEVQEGEEYTLPVPTREGYSFEGWYLTADFSGDPVTTITASGDTTFYAKWEQLSVITLDLNGGSLAAGTTLYLKSGEVVYDFMQDYIPAKEGFVFGAWFDGEAELARNTRMPEGGITLTAEYKVGYSVKVYEQKLSLDGYDLAETVSGDGYYDYVGNTVSPELTRQGFRQVSHADEVVSIELKEDAAQNVLELYFDREEYQVTFDPDYPDDAQTAAEGTRTVSVVYGESVTLPTDFTCEGYFLTGWSASKDGDADYALDYIDSLIYNKEDAAVSEPVTLFPERNMMLFAVWSKGYTDMYGGNDFIYHFGEEDPFVYLQRGSIYFRGDYLNGNQFAFYGNDEVMLEGRLNEDGTFSYYDESRRNYVATLYIVGEGIDETTTIAFDGFNGLTYRVEGEDGKLSSSTGTYTIDDSGIYAVTFTSGDLAGQEVFMIIGTITVDGAARPAFQLRDEEEVALGTLPRFGVADRDGNNTVEFVSYKDNIYDLTLNGFGTASMNMGDSVSSYSYVMSEDGNQISLLNSMGMAVGVARIVEINGITGYMLYSENYDATYTAADGSTLVLDGLYQATYTKNGVSEQGIYCLYASSALGGTVIAFTDTNGTARYFIVDSERTGTGDDAVTVYSFTEKPVGYREYQYQADNSIYYAPLIVLNDTAVGQASVYGYNTETGEYALVLTGRYEYDETNGLYMFTAEGEPADADVSDAPVDLSSVKSIVFAVTVTTASNGTSYQVNYWHSAVIESENGTETNEDYTVEYVCSNIKGGKLTLVGGFAILEQNGNRYFGAYSASQSNENVLGIAVTQNGSVAGYLYVELDPDGGTYYSMDTAPYTAQAVRQDNSIATDETLAFDGKGGAVYTVGEKEYTGTVEEEGSTDMGYIVYKFTSAETTFTFLQLSGNSRYYFIRYNDSFGEGDYASEEAGRLVLDGYAYARYTATDGNTYEGMYYLISDEVSSQVLVLVSTSGRTFYFDYKDMSAGEFTVRGWEYGTFLYMDNQAVEGVYIRLDGYGGAALYTVSTGEEGETVYNYIDRNASYTLNEDGTVSVMYKESSESAVTTTVTGTLGVVTVSSTQSIPVFVKLYEEFVSTFVNTEDWSVLILDGYGNVTRYDTAGVAESGSYIVITEDLLYYANGAGTDASLYTYDSSAGTMSPVSLTQHAYYTEELESLLFTEYGFAIFNGETRYYYNVENGKVTIYLQDPSAPEANEYGFVTDTESIPSFTDQLTYDGKTYYENDGFRLSFSRATESADKYPVLVDVDDEGNETKEPLGNLYFQPSGASEFRVSGTVTVGDNTLNCTVVREKVEEGVYDMYVLMPTVGGVASYRFDISVSYRGSSAGGQEEGGSTYEVTSMSLVSTLPSNNYLTLYYLMYLFYGAASANSFENVFGEITMITEYDEAGEAGEPYVNAWFGEASEILDANGELFNIEKAPYESRGNNLYSATFTGADGYDYELYFIVAYNNYVGTYGFQLYGLVRLQELTDSSTGMKVTVGRYVGSDAFAAGSVFSVRLETAEGEALTADSIRYIGEDLYFIVRTREQTGESGETEGDAEQGKILSTTYYKIVLTDKTDETVGEENDNIVPLYGTVTVTAENVDTYYTADGASYVDIRTDDNTVMLLTLGSTVLAVTESSYDEGTQTYTVTAANKSSYTVKITDRVAEITELSE